jgi:hypothetical protein
VNLLMIVAIVCFVIGALAPVFGWNLGHFDALAWGLAFFAAGHVWWRRL